MIAKRSQIKVWRIPVTLNLDNMLEKALELNVHVSRSDFVREAVREKLAKMGLMETLTRESLEGEK